MNFLYVSPISASIFCSSDDVPSVAATSPPGSPRGERAGGGERGAGGPRQHAHLAGDRAHVGEAPTIDALALVDDRLPEDRLLQAAEEVLHLLCPLRRR